MKLYNLLCQASKADKTESNNHAFTIILQYFTYFFCEKFLTWAFHFHYFIKQKIENLFVEFMRLNFHPRNFFFFHSQINIEKRKPAYAMKELKHKYS